jgi:hypothetical protein
MAVTQGLTGQQNAQAQAQADARNANNAAVLGTIGTIGGAVIGGAPGAAVGSKVGTAASDESHKKNIKATTNELKKLLDKLESYTYEYKDKKDNDGTPDVKRAGVLAQELESSGDLGKAMVEDTPEGKQINYGQGFSTMMASLVELNKRINKLEGGDE